MSNNIQFRRGSKQDYDAIKASGNADLHDIYLVGGEEHKDVITTTGADGKETTKEELKPLSIFVGDETVQTVLSKPIIVTKTVGGVSSSKGTLQPGESIEDILRQILSECINPTSRTLPSASVYFSDSTSKLTVDKGLKFIGETVTIDNIKLRAIAGAYQESNIPGQAKPEYTKSDFTVRSSATNGFANYTTTSANGVAAASASIPSQTGITVSNGNNKVLATGYYTYSKPTNRPKNNFGEEVEPNANNSWLSSASATDSGTVTATGVYPIFSNATFITKDGSENCTNAPAQNITTHILKKTDGTPIIDTYNSGGPRRLRIEGIANTNIKIAVPSGITISRMNAFDKDNGNPTVYSSSADGSDKYAGSVYDLAGHKNIGFTTSATTSYTIGSTAVQYNIYEFNTKGNGLNTYKVTFGGSKQS
jgi:hypothetical protein